jgi:hypothetical protein
MPEASPVGETVNGTPIVSTGWLFDTDDDGDWLNRGVCPDCMTEQEREQVLRARTRAATKPRNRLR